MLLNMWDRLCMPEKISRSKPSAEPAFIMRAAPSVAEMRGMIFLASEYAGAMNFRT